jgi:hypothetical protein
MHVLCDHAARRRVIDYLKLRSSLGRRNRFLGRRWIRRHQHGQGRWQNQCADWCCRWRWRHDELDGSGKARDRWSASGGYLHNPGRYHRWLGHSQRVHGRAAPTGSRYRSRTSDLATAHPSSHHEPPRVLTKTAQDKAVEGARKVCRRRSDIAAIFAGLSASVLLAFPLNPSAALMDCGQPISTGNHATSGDALAVLASAVGRPSSCETKSCICDVIQTPFECDDGEKIFSGLQCNGYENCDDGSDEEDCDRPEFFCSDGSFEISGTFVCDGYEHCPDASDEACVDDECGAISSSSKRPMRFGDSCFGVSGDF